MKKNHILKIAGALGFAASFTGATEASGDSRPNVLFIFVDDLRPDGIGALGNEIVQTPNMDAVVERGFAFRNAYNMGSMRGAVCLPSRIMVLTGQSVHKAENRASGARPSEYTFPMAMRTAGYATMHAEKGGNVATAINAEFDEHFSDSRETWAEQLCDRAIDFIERKAGKKPFFIYLAPLEPHDPQRATDEFYDMYSPEGIPLPARFKPLHPFDNGDMAIRDELTLPWPRTEEDVKGKLARYYASTSYLDYHLGRVIETLKKTGQYDNTLIVLAGDNGLSLGDHGLLGKQNLYEFGGMHTPMIFAGLGIPAGESEALVYLMDIFPTVCETIGIPIPDRVEGRSLTEVIQGRQAKVRDVLFTLYRECQRAVRNDRWKLIRYPLINKTQLFDLETDPYELNNLAYNDRYAGKVDEMMSLLRQQQEKYQDPWPLTVENPLPSEWTAPSREEARAQWRERRGRTVFPGN